MTRQCSVCRQRVLIEFLQDPGGICRDCYAETQIRDAALGRKETMSTTTTELAKSPLREIEEDLEALLDSLDVCPEELREELSTKIEVYVGKLASKVDSIAGVLKSLEEVQMNAKAERDRLMAREKAAERAQNRLESYVLEVLRKRPDQKLKGKFTTLSIRTSEALVITNPDLVPAEWKHVVQTVTIPKDPIKRALKQGIEIPGTAILVHEHLSRR